MKSSKNGWVPLVKLEWIWFFCYSPIINEFTEFLCNILKEQIYGQVINLECPSLRSGPLHKASTIIVYPLVPEASNSTYWALCRWLPERKKKATINALGQSSRLSKVKT